MRESFLLNYTCPLHQVKYAEQGDFHLNRQITIEVGGSNKSRQQIASVPNAYIAADSINIGYGDKVPLWLFGLLY